MKVLILTIHESQEYLHEAIRVGADGYVLKHAAKDELFTAVRSLAAGRRFFSAGISELMVDDFIRRVQEGNGKPRGDGHSLTRRETEILRYIVQGLTNKEIGEKIFVSVRTVNSHRNNLMQKLDIHDTAGLVRYAIKAGMVDLKS